MFRRKTKSKSSFLSFRTSNRGSDITRPNNTSLIVNQSDTEEIENLPKELTSIFSDDEDCDLGNSSRKSSSLMKSLSQKKQSTPLSQSLVREGGKRHSQKPNHKDRDVLGKVISNSQGNKNSFFEEVLKFGGASPLPGNSSFLMSEDQAVFSIKVNKKLTDDPQNIQKFIIAFSEKIHESEYLQKMLAHTLTAENCEVARGPVQEPMLRMLLNVDCIRADLVECLLTLIAEFLLDNKVESQKVQLISSILRQMRYLNGAKDVNLTYKLFEIIHVASVNVKKEIIFLLPEIIPPEETEEICSRLMELLKFDEVLTHVIIDALANLPLGQSSRSQVFSKILNRLDKCPMEFLPSLVQFLVNKSDPEEHVEVIEGLRKNLPFTPLDYQMRTRSHNKSSSDENSYIKLTFENLKYSAMASKQMADSWLKVISSLDSPYDFRCVDWVVLIIFYNCLFGKKNKVLQIIRNKIRSGVLTRTHVQDMFKVLLIVAEEYCSSILELASFFLKSIEQKLSSFGASLYKECFINFNFYMKQLLINELLVHIGTGPVPTVNTALDVLKELCTFEKESLSQHTSSIMGLLIKVQDLNLSQVRVLMDIMAELAFFESLEAAVQDELQIFIMKQLMSSKSEQFKKGISAAIMFAKHSIGKEDICSESDFTEINSLLEMAMGLNWTSEIKRGFFNDEFATMVKESQLNKSFLEIWSKKTSSIIMDHVIVENIEIQCSDFPMSQQYFLPGSGTQKPVFPAVAFVLREAPVSFIPSALRLLWCLEGNPDRVLSVFHASVIMPDTSVYDGFDSLDESQKKKIMNCLFLCGNFLIESVNALFAHKRIYEAVLRIKQLIQVRKLIARHIDSLFDYVPPVCQFYAPAQKVVTKRKQPEKKKEEKKGKRGRKRKLDEPETSSHFSVESQPISETPAAPAEENAVPVQNSVQEASLQAYSRYFRELDHSTYKLLAVDFGCERTKSNLDNQSQMSPEIQEKPELETSEILFLLEDLVQKSEEILKSTDSFLAFKQKPAALLQKISPECFVKAALEILPGLLKKIETFSEYCENMLESNDWIYDSNGLYLQDAHYVKLAMTNGLKFISGIISWKEFSGSNSGLFKDFLIILSKKCSPRDLNASLESLSELAGSAAKYLASFTKTVLLLSGGLSIVKSFQVCLQHSSESPSALADLCMEFLSRKWFTVTGAPDKGAAYNQNVDFLLKTYFSSVENKLEVVRTTAKVALDEVGGLTSKDSTLKTFRTINKANFPLLYRTLCEALVSASTNKLSKTDSTDQKTLDIWYKIVDTLLTLVEIAKIHSSRVILASLLKKSQSIVQLFLKKGMAVAQTALRVKSVEVLSLLKSFQVVTRFLHSICCHSRLTNDSLVASHVPAIRSLCEQLTLEVKGMLILNGIPMDCITIAILKNKDIKGNDVVSQDTVEEESDDDSELPPEDTPDVEEEEREATPEFQNEDF